MNIYLFIQRYTSMNNHNKINVYVHSVVREQFYVSLNQITNRRIKHSPLTYIAQTLVSYNGKDLFKA